MLAHKTAIEKGGYRGVIPHPSSQHEKREELHLILPHSIKKARSYTSSFLAASIILS
jgi:hypothetical protein